MLFSSQANADRSQKVLLITRKWPPAVGGMETYSFELSAELEKLPQIVLHKRVLPGRQDGRPPHVLSIAWFFVTTSWHLFAHGSEYDVVHFGDLAQIGLAAVGRRFSPKTRNVIALHGLDVVYGRRSGFLPCMYRYYLNWGRGRNCIDCFIANSRNTGRLLAEQGFGPIAVVPLGVRLSSTSVRVTVDQIGAERFVLFFGRVFRRKGPRWFAEYVLPLLPEDVRFVVVGTIWDEADGEYLLQHSRVRMPGAFPVDFSRDEFEAMKRQAVAIVMPNVLNPDGKDVEGFGLTALEAADGGAPLIAADLEGIRDAVRDGETGFLVPPEDPGAWARKIGELLNWSVEQRSEFAQSARYALGEHYSWERVARDTIVVYQGESDFDEEA